MSSSEGHDVIAIEDDGGTESFGSAGVMLSAPLPMLPTNHVCHHA
jgi:hypothetical protein